jgi:hypothetical protein
MAFIAALARIVTGHGLGDPLEQCDDEKRAQYHSDIVQELQR